MPPRHSSYPTPRAAGLPPKGGTPTPEGRAHAHRSDFLQGAYTPAETAVFGQSAPDLLNLPRVGVRKEWEAMVVKAVAAGRAVLPAGVGVGVLLQNRHTGRSVAIAYATLGNPYEPLRVPDEVFERTPSALRAPGDISGAGAPALMRAPALPRGKRAAR